MPKMKDFLENVNSLCITGHVRPDGDCVGSCLGLFLYVKKNYPGVDVQLYLEEPSEKLAFLKGFEQINSFYPDHEAFDLMICLDSASRERIGKAEKYFKNAKHTVNIDHHVSNTMFADENYVDGQSSSASEEIYKFMDAALIDRDVAIALYTGIIYDTGVFKYPSTSPLTMQIAGELMKHDIPTDRIIDESHLAFDGRVIYSTITQKELKEFGVSSKELEGIVSQLRLTKGVIASAFLYETTAGDIKLSLRSIAPFDVDMIAQQFGGGGHVRAAGATLKGTLEESVTQVLAAMEKNL